MLHSCMRWICSAVDEACVVGPLLDTVLSIVCALESPRATSCRAVLYQPFCKVAGEVNLLVWCAGSMYVCCAGACSPTRVIKPL